MDEKTTVIQVILILALLFGAAAIGLLLWSLRGQRKAQASLRWPATTGTVLKSDVQSDNTASDTSIIYYPVVEYAYKVNGQSYQGSRIRFGPVTGRSAPGPSQETVAKYPAGAHVAVYFDPDRPDEAVLERAAPGSNALLSAALLVVVILLVVLCAAILVVSVIGGRLRF